jgi:hypothetical protein
MRPALFGTVHIIRLRTQPMAIHFHFRKSIHAHLKGLVGVAAMSDVFKRISFRYTGSGWNSQTYAGKPRTEIMQTRIRSVL